MRDFSVVIGAYKEESAGQIKELVDAVERFRLPKFFSAEEIAETDTTDLMQTEKEVKIGDLDRLVYLKKEKNPDLVIALRHLLSFGAKGVVLTFGNNETRDYIRDGKAYSAKEVKAFAEELLRLAPLFGRRIV